MDRDLTDLARRNPARYSRYADDMTFSFPVRKTSRLPAAVCVVDDDGDLHVGAELQDLITNKQGSVLRRGMDGGVSQHTGHVR
jgi:RNA-directed DNA polymerase